MVINNERLYAHADGLGNVIALTDETQGVRRVYAYDDWGNDGGTGGTLAAPNADRARWKGALWLGPELDLYYMRNRWYEPGTGRFLSEDPVGLGGGINPVVFGGADPVNRRDPAGLDFRLTDDPRECLALGMRVAVRNGRLGCEEGAFQLPDLGTTAPFPFGPVDPFLPNPVCPTCEPPRDPNDPPSGTLASPEKENPSFGEKVLACTLDQLGIRDLIALGVGASGLPLLDKRFSQAGGSQRTSLASRAFRNLNNVRLPRQVWAPTLRKPLAASRKVGTILGRFVPGLGVALLAIDAGFVAHCVLNE